MLNICMIAGLLSALQQAGLNEGRSGEDAEVRERIEVALDLAKRSPSCQNGLSLRAPRSGAGLTRGRSG